MSLNMLLRIALAAHSSNASHCKVHKALRGVFFLVQKRYL
jgi:hypothetical protein